MIRLKELLNEGKNQYFNRIIKKQFGDVIGHVKASPDDTKVSVGLRRRKNIDTANKIVDWINSNVKGWTAKYVKSTDLIFIKRV